jgi:hypothetical protein
LGKSSGRERRCVGGSRHVSAAALWIRGRTKISKGIPMLSIPVRAWRGALAAILTASAFHASAQQTAAAGSLEEIVVTRSASPFAASRRTISPITRKAPPPFTSTTSTSVKWRALRFRYSTWIASKYCAARRVPCSVAMPLEALRTSSPGSQPTRTAAMWTWRPASAISRVSKAP